ncbi:PaaI family thioesterase [Alteraurantiacibacter aquimixticola]|uniref:PaaI family thioesterase n=2 Tax=Alteraurantiacibacter aquimixticola TaxID=2489173 RepID=A0A4T3F158_9SPHN|nr:PaaI family thioesterase [Alteraurantiacibacter aquimixticola]
MDREQPHGLTKLLGIELVEAEEGYVVLTGTATPDVYNMLGIAHGGFAATLLDSACGLAATSALPDASHCVTLEVKVAYHAAITEDAGELRAIGNVLSLTRRTAYAEAKLVDANGKLYGSATSTLYIAPQRT